MINCYNKQSLLLATHESELTRLCLLNSIMSYRNLKIVSLVLLSLVLPGTQSRAVTTLDLPEIGDSAGSVISPEFERRLGQAFMRQVRQQVKIVQDPEVESYIQSIGYQLVAQSDTNTQPFTFFIVDDPQINAFAAPGGVIGVNSGVILNSRTESELAAVMAHEIVHVTQRHMARTIEDAGKFSLPIAAAMIGAILLGTQSAEAGSAALAIISGASIQHQINFTRTNEEEADRVGMQLLARSDYDPRGMPAFFERLQQSSRYYRGQAPEFLQTHPLTPAAVTLGDNVDHTIRRQMRIEPSRREHRRQRHVRVRDSLQPGRG